MWKAKQGSKELQVASQHVNLKELCLHVLMGIPRGNVLGHVVAAIHQEDGSGEIVCMHGGSAPAASHALHCIAGESNGMQWQAGLAASPTHP